MKSKSSATNDTPVFALTMGDPAGIGPEIAIRALAWG
jgi:4-hydroxy-L-threonine phosphate dehydrogenase PdxA